MKTLGCILLISLVAVSGCTPESVKPSPPLVTSIQGTWKVTKAEFAWWWKDQGLVIPRKADPSKVSTVIIIKADSSTMDFGPYNEPVVYYHILDVSDSSISYPPDANTGIGFFTISDFQANTMVWSQREPIDADFRSMPGVGPPPCPCPNVLYTQHFWTLTRM